jgi:sugar (pentulose or hexulose) kinase
MTKEHLLALDNGTQSVRALVFDLQGQLVARSRVALEPYFSDHPGWAEQHPQYFWKSLCEACQKLWQQPAVDPNALAGVALTTQRGTVVNLDRQGKPLRPAIVWLDKRRSDDAGSLGGPWGALFGLLGVNDTIRHLLAEAEAVWLQRNQPDLWRKTDKFLLLSGYLTYRLTGRFVDSVGCQVGYLPFDYRRHRWAGPTHWSWRAIPITPSMLPELQRPGQVLGSISRAASEATGIPAGLPLVAAGADKACAVLGAGGVTPDIGCLSYGTTATVNTTHSRYVEAIPLIPPYPAAMPRAYSLEIQIYRGYWMVSWFKEQFAHRERALAEQRGVEPEALFDELLQQVPPGSMGLMLQPYWSPGVRIPGPEAKGTIIGFGDVHTRAHLYRAILEGIAYGLREGKERCEKRTRQPVKELRVTGGGSQSDGAMQLTADIFGLPASRPHTNESSGLGAAIDAAVGLGLHRDFPTAVKEMTRLGDTFQPDPANHRLYDALYRRVYLRMYERLKPLYEEIRKITGYPRRLGL